jgi:hypothetical protein
LQAWMVKRMGDAPSLEIERAQIRKANGEVVFGSPSQNCAGEGICFVSAYRPDRKRMFACSSVSCRLYSHAGLLWYITFRKEDIDPALRMRYFSTDVFLIDEPFHLERSLAKALGLASDLVPDGRCQVLEHDHFFLIVFPSVGND